MERLPIDFTQQPIEKGKKITVERWLRRMWLDPTEKRKTKPRRALTVVQKKQGVAVLLVGEKDQWDACTKLAENKDTSYVCLCIGTELVGR